MRPPPIGIWNEYKRELGKIFDNVSTGKPIDIAEALERLQDQLQKRFDYEMKWSAVGKQNR